MRLDQQKIEVEIRSLAGESWLVVPEGDRVKDLRSSIAAADLGGAASTLFAGGQKLDNENELLPEPQSGERLVVHISPGAIRLCGELMSDSAEISEWYAEQGIDDLHVDVQEVLDIPDSPVRSAASPAVPSSLPTPRPCVALMFICFSLMAAAAAAIGAGCLVRTPADAPTERGRDARSKSIRSAAQSLGWGSPLTERHALQGTAKLALEHNKSAFFSIRVGQKPHSAIASPQPAAATPVGGASPAQLRPSPPRPPLLISLSRLPGNEDEEVGELNATLTWPLDSLLRRTAPDAPTSPPTTKDPMHVTEAYHWQLLPYHWSMITVPYHWRQQLVRAVKLVPLATATLSLWRPASRRVFTLLLVLAKTLLPAHQCERLVRFVETHGIVPYGFPSRGLGDKTCAAMTEASRKKL